MFRDRLDAARRLAERLAEFRGRRPLVLGIPRGAVPMAKYLATQLQGEWDVVLVRKLGAPRPVHTGARPLGPGRADCDRGR